MRIIAYYPQSKQVIEYYRDSDYFSGEDKFVPITDLADSVTSTDQILIVGREGNTHDADVDHIRTIRKIRGIQHRRDLSLVCFDWHHDIDNESKYSVNPLLKILLMY